MNEATSAAVSGVVMILRGVPAHVLRVVKVHSFDSLTLGRLPFCFVGSKQVGGMDQGYQLLVRMAVSSSTSRGQDRLWVRGLRWLLFGHELAVGGMGSEAARAL